MAMLRVTYGDKDIATMAGHVVHAKSIFDALEKECIGIKGERRAAIGLAIVREDLFHGGGRVRWVSHTNKYCCKIIHDVLHETGTITRNG